MKRRGRIRGVCSLWRSMLRMALQMLVLVNLNSILEARKLLNMIISGLLNRARIRIGGKESLWASPYKTFEGWSLSQDTHASYNRIYRTHSWSISASLTFAPSVCWRQLMVTWRAIFTKKDICEHQRSITQQATCKIGKCIWLMTLCKCNRKSTVNMSQAINWVTLSFSSIWTKSSLQNESKLTETCSLNSNVWQGTQSEQSGPRSTHWKEWILSK